MIGIQTTERNGKLVAAVLMGSNDEVLLISDGGTWCVRVARKSAASAATPRASP